MKRFNLVVDYLDHRMERNRNFVKRILGKFWVWFGTSERCWITCTPDNINPSILSHRITDFPKYLVLPLFHRKNPKYATYA
jgi:hypothetical protein